MAREVAYGGPHFVVFQKVGAAGFAADIAAVLSPYTFADAEEWWLDEGIFEVGQRCSICMASGGTPEAMKIIVSCVLAIGQ